MGGIGSGRRYHLGSKGTVDSSLYIDIRYLNRQGMLKSGYTGTLSWSRNGHRTGSISFSVAEDEMILDYTSDGERFRYPVAILYSECNYGGRRPWLQCPRCLRRVGKLMLISKMFVCRHCGELAYQSQRDNDKFRWLDKTQVLRKRLGGSMSTMEAIPWKPKGMHWKTYQRIRNQIEFYEYKMWTGMLESMESLASRIGAAR